MSGSVVKGVCGGLWCVDLNSEFGDDVGALIASTLVS